MRPSLLSIRCFAVAALSGIAFSGAFAQANDDAVRVTVTVNPDGSKITYETNAASHRCVATMTSASGKRQEKIVYRLDDQGRYASGDVYSGSGAFRFKTNYRYDATGRLVEETQRTKAGAVLHRIVYNFDRAGHPAGYTIYDGNGNLLGRTTARQPAAANPRR